jgi:hypothetical protein
VLGRIRGLGEPDVRGLVDLLVELGVGVEAVFAAGLPLGAVEVLLDVLLLDEVLPHPAISAPQANRPTSHEDRLRIIGYSPGSEKKRPPIGSRAIRRASGSPRL